MLYAFSSEMGGIQVACCGSPWRIAFGKIEIEVAGWRENGFVAAFFRTDGVVDIVPNDGHHWRIDLSAHDNLFPTDYGATALFHPPCHLIGKPALQFGNFGEAFALHEGLAVGTLAPTGVDGLIAADVDIF